MLDEILFRQAQVISRRQALRHLSAGAVERRLAAGRWRALHRGVYVTHTGPVTQEQWWWAALMIGGSGDRPALLGGLSALERYGLRGFAGDGVHVVVAAERHVRNPPPWVVLHRTRRLAGADVQWPGSPPATRPARSLLDAARWARTDDRARAVIAAGVQQRLATAPDLVAALRRAPRDRRPAVLADAVRDAVAGAHSVPEADFLRLCRRHGLPVPELQHERRDADGRRRYLDAWFPAYRVHVEIDGGQHTDAHTWWADMQRQNQVWIAGDRVLRFPAWVVRARPGEVVAQVRAALAAGGWDVGG